MSDRPSVDILLSSYNGVAFLAAQIESIMRQTHEQWTLWVRDDGSTDGTVSLVRRLCARQGDRVACVAGGQRLGPAASFGRLAEKSTAPYAMFCDQDDVWFPDKVQRSLARIKAMETKHGKGVPVLAFSDLVVTDSKMNIIAGSFMRYSDRRPANAVLPKLLIRNQAPGCSMIVNRALMNAALPVPPEAIMHDYWFMLVASLIGRIGYIPEPTLYYRQHSSNTLGAYCPARCNLQQRLDRLQRVWRTRHKYPAFDERCIDQARALLHRFQGRVPKRTRKLISDFLAFSQWSPKRRKLAILRCGMLPFGFWGNIELLLGS